jgi:hypothetical protein
VDRFVNVPYCSGGGCSEKRLNRWVSTPVAWLCTGVVCLLLIGQATAKGEKVVIVTLATIDVTNTNLLFASMLIISFVFSAIEKFKSLWPAILFGLSIPSTLYTFIKIISLAP